MSNEFNSEMDRALPAEPAPSTLRPWIKWLQGLGWTACSTLAGLALLLVFGWAILQIVQLVSRTDLLWKSSLVLLFLSLLGALAGLVVGIVLAVKWTRQRPRLALAGGLIGLAAGLVSAVILGGVWATVWVIFLGRGFSPVNGLFGAVMTLPVGPAAGLAAGLGAAWVGKRKWGPLEWALTAFLGALLGAWIGIPLWKNHDRALGAYTVFQAGFGLVLGVVAAAAAALASGWVNRMAGKEAPFEPVPRRWFLGHFLGLVFILALCALALGPALLIFSY